MRVRRVVPDEWARLRELRLRALATDPRAFGATLAEEEAQPDEWWRSRLADVRAATLIAGDWQGMCTIRIADDAAHAEIFGMWVAPEARGSGAGRAIIDAAIDQARAWKLERVDLWVNVEQAAAARLYERAGFRRAGPAEPGKRDPTRTYQRMARSI